MNNHENRSSSDKIPSSALSAYGSSEALTTNALTEELREKHKLIVKELIVQYPDINKVHEAWMTNTRKTQQYIKDNFS